MECGVRGMGFVPCWLIKQREINENSKVHSCWLTKHAHANVRYVYAQCTRKYAHCSANTAK